MKQREETFNLEFKELQKLKKSVKDAKKVDIFEPEDLKSSKLETIVPSPLTYGRNTGLPLLSAKSERTKRPKPYDNKLFYKPDISENRKLYVNITLY